MIQPTETINQLIKKYDRDLPRYTSYPTAPHFHSGFSNESYKQDIARSNASLIPRPLSLYLHIPFCHSLCYFCGCNKTVIADKKRMEAKVEEYLEALIEEIHSKAALFDSDRLVHQIHFGGGTPNCLSTRQLEELLGEIAQAFHLNLPNHVDIGIELDPRYTSAQGIRDIAELGFNRFSIGVQDFCSEVQKAVNRIQDKQNTLDIINAASLFCDSINVDLITGLPNQTVASLRETIEAIANTNASRLAVYGFAFLPDRIKPQRMIDTNLLPSPELRLELQNCTAQALRENGFKHIGMDHYAKESDPLYRALKDGTLQRNFQGYSTHSGTDLVGLGVSAISSSDSAFSQNTTSIAKYQRSIKDKGLAIEKGISLSPDDQLRQTMIQQLMCSGEINLNKRADEVIDGTGALTLSEYFKTNLNQFDEFVNEGILTKSPNSYSLTELGRFFMRPVAASFDAYMNNSGTNGGLTVAQFSRAI